MTKLSFLDKLGVLINVSKSSKMFVLIIAFIIFLGIIFFTTTKKNNKRTKTIYILCVSFITAFLIIAYHSSLSSMIDYMMNNFFIALYFPNLAIYIAAIIIANIILLVSLFNYKVPKLIKNINIVFYCILNYILALVLYIVTNKNLDVFNSESVYGNKNAQALIEMSSIIFIVWILFLIIYKLIMIYLRKDYIPPVKKVYVKKKVRVLPENIKEISYPQTVKGIVKEVKTNTPKIEPLSKEEKMKRELDKMLTLDDYKVLLKILKEHKLNEKYIKDIEKQQQKEIDKFKELQDLYKNVK